MLVTDDDTGSVAGSTNVVVNNLAPSALVVSGATINPGVCTGLGIRLSVVIPGRREVLGLHRRRVPE